MSSVPTELKALRQEAEPRLTVRAMADALNVPASTYAAYEDLKKFKKPVLPLDLAKRIANVLAERGVERTRVLRLAGVTGELGQPAAETEILQVEGVVAAGVWREQTSWTEPRYSIEVGPNPIPGTERFAVRNEGESMNKTIPSGSDLECIRVSFGVIEPRPGDLVIVERNNHDLTEMTCKRLDIEDDIWVLRCESYDPEFQYVIRLGKPDRNLFVDNEIRIIGIVIGAQQRHFRPRN